MKDRNDVNTSRRSLLKGITTAAVATTIAAGTTKVANAATGEMPSVKKDKKGYHETQHIRDYYDTL
ncbi:formate dehydrogenase [Vibrio sp. JCM 19236]|nr:formate dehydrogenase [Vibrio sp. JCM 19236]